MHLRSLLCLIAFVIVIFAAPVRADDVDFDPFILYGVNGATNQLLRYDFAESQLQTIGTLPAGIEALAYMPGNLNLFAFYLDPEINRTRLLYVNSYTAESHAIGADLGPGKVFAATTAMMDVDQHGHLILGTDGDHDKGHGNDCDGVDEDNPGNSTGVSENGMGHGAHSGCFVEVDPNEPTPVADIERLRVFAVQKVEAEEDDPVDFTIDGGHVVPGEPYAAKVAILGAAITYGGQYDIPVTVRVRIGDDVTEPFGDFDKAVSGNVNDGDSSAPYIAPQVFDAGTPITIRARSWTRKKPWYNGKSNNHWDDYLTVDSDDNSPQVLTLRNGDAVPDIDPFMDQNNLVDFIRDYIDDETNTVVLDENQAIYLFELGTTPLWSDAADFQDLVVLVTLAHQPADLEEDEDDDEQVAPAARLIRVNTLTGTIEQLMTLSREYDGLAASPTSRFYATAGLSIYRLDPIDQTETLLGSLPAADMKGLEYAGPTMCGFTIIDDLLKPIAVDGSPLGNSINLGAANLESIVFMKKADAPNPLAAAYD